MRAPNAGPLCGPNRLVVALAMVPDRQADGEPVVRTPHLGWSMH